MGRLKTSLDDAINAQRRAQEERERNEQKQQTLTQQLHVSDVALANLFPVWAQQLRQLPRIVMNTLCFRNPKTPLSSCDMIYTPKPTWSSRTSSE